MITEQQKHDLTTFRGQAWVKVFKQVDESDHIESLRQSLLSIKATGKLTLRDLANAYIDHDLEGIAGRTYFRFIEGPVIKHGVYDDFVERGGKWSSTVDEVKAERQVNRRKIN